MPPKKKKEPERAPVDESFQAVDISTREPRTVVLMLSSPEQAVVVKACQALHTYMEKSEQNCVDMAGLGVVSCLVGLLSSPDKTIRAYAALSLSAMTHIGCVRKQVLAADGLPPLLALLTPEEEVVTTERAASIAAHMTTEYSTKTQLLSLDAHQKLLPLITGADPDTQKHSLTALCQLAELHQARQAIAQEGGVAALLGLLSSEYPPIQQLALQTLLSCAHDKESRTQLREADGLTQLVAFLGNKECSDLHLLAVSVLSLCLRDADNMTALQSSGSLDLLLSQVAAPGSQSDMKRCATQALATAARDDVNRKILHEQNVEKTFIELLTSDDCGVVVAALDGMAAMCALSSGRICVGQGGGAGGVVSCSGRGEGQVRAAAAQCLAHLSAESPANCKLVQEAGGCVSLVQLLSDSQALSRSGAAATISNMAASQNARDELLAANVVSALVSCLGFTEVTVQRSAAEALAVLSADAAARAQFLSSGGVASLLPLLLSPHRPLVTSALTTVRATAQSIDVAQEFCAKGALQLLTQLSQGSHVPSSVGPALQRLLNSDLSAKWWMEGRLEASDVIMEIEFFDPGPALSSSQPFTPLSSLLSDPLHMNRPILTANLLHREAPPTPTETTPTTIQPVEPSPSQGRAKSRVNAKSRKGREVESRVSDSSNEEQLQTVQSYHSEAGKGVGLLPVDQGLLSHITHTLSHISPLPTLTEQAQALASYVCNSMGGPVANTGNMPYELPQSQAQKGAESNVVAIGDIAMGTYRHRALLYKVLADQLGLACSLVRGDYGRHWNEVTIATDHPCCHVVDLMTSGGQLLLAGSPQAELYLHL